MQILSIRNITPNRQYNTVQHPQFKGITVKADKIGMLGYKTSYMIQDFLHGYDEIKKVLGRKTEEGLRKISLNYPEITLGENIIFHNCGDEKNSISVRVADSEQNRGLVYIARRQGNTENTKKIILNSFMLDGNSRLVSNFKPNYSKYFPKEREYFSQETIDNLNLEQNLQNIFTDLEPMILKFRKFLAKNAESDLKLPEGKIAYPQIAKIKEAFRICREIEEKIKKISHKRYLAMNNDYEDYSNISGLKSYMFKNLGEDNLAINFSEHADKQGYNLKRLYVYNQENKLIKLFTIIDNNKFATNINSNTPSVLPEKYTYANTKELEETYLPEFQKYFKLYIDKLKDYQKHVNKTVDSFLKQEINGEFDINTSSLLSEALDWYNLAKVKLRKLPNKVANSIKSEVQGLEPYIGQTGLYLKDDEAKKIIQFLPINSKLHENLIRISITDMQTSEKKDFLIHKFKHIVKNYNPQYPTIIPKFLKYATQNEVEDSNIENCFRYLRSKCENLAVKADEAFETREALAKELDEKRKIKKAEKSALGKYKELKADCKKMLEGALNNLDNGIEDFNKAIIEIQNKVMEFYNSQNPKLNN